jgi:hypothetical protein
MSLLSFYLQHFLWQVRCLYEFGLDDYFFGCLVILYLWWDVSYST